MFNGKRLRKFLIDCVTGEGGGVNKRATEGFISFFFHFSGLEVENDRGHRLNTRSTIELFLDIQ